MINQSDLLLSVSHATSNQYITVQIIQMLNDTDLLAKLAIADSYLYWLSVLKLKSKLCLFHCLPGAVIPHPAGWVSYWVDKE